MGSIRARRSRTPGDFTSSLNLRLSLPITNKGLYPKAHQFHETSSQGKTDSRHHAHIAELPKAPDKPGESSEHARRRGTNSRRHGEPELEH